MLSSNYFSKAFCGPKDIKKAANELGNICVSQTQYTRLHWKKNRGERLKSNQTILKNLSIRISIQTQKTANIKEATTR